MCGRYLFSNTENTFINNIKKYYQNQLPFEVFQQIHFDEIRPTDKTVVFLNDENNKLIPQVMSWGLTINKKRVINLRNENGIARHYKPCLVIASGYYEWDQDTKQRYLFSTSNHLIIMAACYNNKNEFAIITEEANPTLSKIHNRVPLTIKKDEITSYFQGEIIHSNQFSIKID
ncbi:hypothetical protein SDC9_120372 [bioreactor metagenome]|uniref:SOS response-associated peptidase YedK n=1 Tax=bioreactor metagenome TaxID=1076179 RepID=A0A645C6T3_9ZZZZ|nr:SOS response-associated peptidase family protein [Anaerorhabdus sp.]MEA4874027.1 SOS response-associated peptidase family protein [Anaerorhabdus sp.]